MQQEQAGSGGGGISLFSLPKRDLFLSIGSYISVAYLVKGESSREMEEHQSWPPLSRFLEMLCLVWFCEPRIC